MTRLRTYLARLWQWRRIRTEARRRAALARLEYSHDQAGEMLREHFGIGRRK